MQKDAWKVAIGVVIFLGFFTFPIWYNLAVAGDPESGRPVRPNTEQCMLNEEEKLSHMQLLDEWRDEVVREGHRVLEEPRAGHREKSLTRSCMSDGCHRRSEDVHRSDGTFVPPCASCHLYVGVEGDLFNEVYCWDCHLESMELAGRNDDDEQ